MALVDDTSFDQVLHQPPQKRYLLLHSLVPVVTHVLWFGYC